ncbi:MAG: hypothetical protein U5K51_00905 [Flavobacteriaceae bacterium]|nr:hypothetical protein [Flavobacteriaceae bacterium]
MNTTPEYQKIYREGFGVTKPGGQPFESIGQPRQLYTPETESGFTRVNSGTVFYNWGPLLSDDTYTNTNGTVVDLSEDRFYDPMDLYKTGINTMVNFNVAGATEKMDYFFSIGRQNEESTIPNSDFDKTTVRFNGGYQISDKLKISSAISYANSGGRRANGGDKSVSSALAYFSWSYPVNDYKNADGSERDYSFGIIDNPRYYAETSSFVDDVNRWIGSATLKLDAQ